jgi:hypothetical protein
MAARLDPIEEAAERIRVALFDATPAHPKLARGANELINALLEERRYSRKALSEPSLKANQRAEELKILVAQMRASGVASATFREGPVESLHLWPVEPAALPAELQAHDTEPPPAEPGEANDPEEALRREQAEYERRLFASANGG